MEDQYMKEFEKPPCGEMQSSHGLLDSMFEYLTI